MKNNSRNKTVGGSRGINRRATAEMLRKKKYVPPYKISPSYKKKENRTNEIDWFIVFIGAFVLGCVVGGTVVAYLIYFSLWDLLYSCAWTQGYAYAWNISGVIG